MYTIQFKVENSAGGQPLSYKKEVPAGTNLLELMDSLHIAMDSPCSGNGTCGKCRVKVISGAVEMLHNTKLSREDFHEGWRLACQSTVIGDAVLWVPASASAFQKDIRTADLSSAEELARFNKIVAEHSASSGLGERSVPLTHASSYGIYSSYGIAVDIGTTTVTGALLNLQSGQVLSKASLGNAQIRYGADVINRILQSKKPGGVAKLQKAVLDETLYPLISQMLAGTNVPISRIMIAGNTTMEHLLVGADADTIRLEPYEPEFLAHPAMRADELGFHTLGPHIAPEIPVYLAPNVGSYVGGDITAGVLATRLTEHPENTLFIDLGTNGELVFGNEEFMLTCACSAGPAFEGGDISCGMRATPGAIDEITIDAETLEPHFHVLGSETDPTIAPLGLCGSGLIATVSELFRVGAIDGKGNFIKENKRIHSDEYGGTSYQIAMPGEFGPHSIELDEADIANFIRAKAAVFSAILCMLEAVDMRVSDIDRVILAGGIGQGINLEKAVFVGMLPKLDASRYSYIGNSSLTGACLMLLSDENRQKVDEIQANMTYLELSTHPSYMDQFVAACFLPHTNTSLFKD